MWLETDLKSNRIMNTSPLYKILPFPQSLIFFFDTSHFLNHFSFYVRSTVTMNKNIWKICDKLPALCLWFPSCLPLETFVHPWQLTCFIALLCTALIPHFIYLFANWVICKVIAPTIPLEIRGFVHLSIPVSFHFTFALCEFAHFQAIDMILFLLSYKCSSGAGV